MCDISNLHGRELKGLYMFQHHTAKSTPKYWQKWWLWEQEEQVHTNL